MAIRTAGFVFGLLATFLFAIPIGMVIQSYWPVRHRHFAFRSNKKRFPALPLFKESPRKVASIASPPVIEMTFVHRPARSPPTFRLCEPPRGKRKIELKPSFQSFRAEIGGVEGSKQVSAPPATDRVQKPPSAPTASTKVRAEPRVRRQDADRYLQEVYFDGELKTDVGRDFKNIPL